jgi:hypothetical protein
MWLRPKRMGWGGGRPELREKEGKGVFRGKLGSHIFTSFLLKTKGKSGWE